MAMLEMSPVNEKIVGTDDLLMMRNIEKVYNNSTEDYLDEFIDHFKEEIGLTKKPFVSEILQGDGSTLKDSCSTKNLSAVTDEDGNSLLMVMAQQGRLEILKMFFKCGVFSIKQTSHSGTTALHFAAGVKNNCGTIELLASNGADINVKDSEGRTPIFIGAFKGHVDAVESLVKKYEGDIDAPDRYGRTALMAASQQGHVGVVRKLIELGAEVMCETESKKTALFYACMKKHAEIVQILVENNRNLLDHTDREGRTVVMKCAATGNLEMIELLQSLGANLDMKDKTGLSALMIASEKEHTEIVQYLVKKCGNVNETNDQGQTALHLAACTTCVEVLKILLVAGCEVNKGDHVGDVPLFLSTRKGSTECVQLLLEQGAQVDKQNKSNETALMEAIRLDQYEIAKLLQRNGASIHTTSNSGTSAKDLASVSPNMSIREYFSSLGTTDDSKNLFLAIEVGNVDILKQSKHDVNVTNAAGFTPLMVAAGKGSCPMVKYLCSHEASVNAQTATGITAFACAVSYKNREVIDVLLGYGADINIKTITGQTLLHKCVEENRLSFVKIIVRVGANLEVTDKSGRTPLMIAAEKSQMDIVEYLVTEGAKLDTKSKEGLTAASFAVQEVQAFLMAKETEFAESARNDVIGKTLILEARKADPTKLKQLLKSKAPVNFRDSHNKGTTALIQACKLGQYQNVKKLCDAGAKIYVTADDGDTPLFSASFHGHPDIVKYLLEKKLANPNVVDTAGRTAIMAASQEGHDKIVECLIHHGALLNIKEKTAGSTALSYASHRGNIHIVKLLLEHHVNIDQVDNEGRTVLTSACLTGFIEIVECLVREGADINHRDCLGRTPIMAASQEGRLNVVQYLFKEGADVSASSSNGMRVIEFADKKGHHDVVDWLKKQGVRVTKALPGNTTKIIEMGNDIIETETVTYTASAGENCQEKLISLCATGQASEEEFKSLIESGALIDQKDPHGVTPLLIAVQNRQRSVAVWLLQAGAEVNCKDTNGSTPLIHAVKTKDLEMVELLIKYKADEKIMDNYGEDVFSYATKVNDTELVMTLITLLQGDGHPTAVFSVPPPSVMKEKTPRSIIALLTDMDNCTVEIVRNVLDQHHVQMDEKDNNGQNAVHYCTKQESSEASGVVKLLSDKGADVNLRDAKGQTPLIECCQHGNTVIARTLINLNAETSVISDYGVNALQEACVWNYCDIVQLLQSSTTWPRHTVDKCVSYSLVNNFDCMLSVLHPDSVNVVDIEVNFIPELVFTGDFVQNLLRSGPWGQEVCLMLSAIYGECNLLPNQEAGQNMSDEIKHKALMLALQRGHYRVATTIYSCTVSLHGECIYVIIDSTNQDVLVNPADDLGNVRQDILDDDSGLEEEYTVDEIELQGHLNQAMDTMYKIFTKAVVRDSPKCIQGFSRSWCEPIIYIYAAKHRKTDAMNYIDRRLEELNLSVVKLIKFQYVEHENKAHFLVQPVKSGSAVTHMTDEQYRIFQQRDRNIIGADYSLATITCFMFSQANEGNSMWAVTVGHLVSTLEHENNDEENGECVVQAAYNGGIVRLPGPYKSALCKYDNDKYKRLIDVSLFKVPDEVQQQELLKMEVPGANVVPDVFRENDVTLKGRRVFKTGAATGHTTGIIIDVDTCREIKGELYTGLFVVHSKTPGYVFAQPGDSGAAIIDEEKKELVGLLIGTDDTLEDDQWVKNTALCVRLDYTLKYIEKEWKLVLCFNRNYVPSTMDEDTDEEADVQQLQQFVDRFKQMKKDVAQIKRDNAKLQKSLTDKDATIALLRRDKQNLRRNLKTYRDHITKGSGSLTSVQKQGPVATKTSLTTIAREETLSDSSIEPIDERISVYCQSKIDSDDPSDEDSDVVLMQEEETDIKEPVPKQLDMTEPVSIVNKNEIPSVSHAEESLGGNQVEQPPTATSRQQQMEQPDESNNEDEPMMFCTVAQEEEKELISCLDSSPQKSLRSVVQDCLSRSSSRDSLEDYTRDGEVKGKSLLSMLKRLHLTQRDLTDVLRKYGLKEAYSVIRMGRMKESLYNMYKKKVSSAKFINLLQVAGIDDSVVQDLSECEFQDQQEAKMRELLSGIKDLPTIRNLLANFCITFPQHRATLIE